LPFACWCLGSGEPVMHHEDVQGCDCEQHHGVARKTIGEPFPASAFEILLHRQGPDIPRTSAIEIPGSAMMHGMLPALGYDRVHQLPRGSRDRGRLKGRNDLARHRGYRVIKVIDGQEV
jgi:hypothetical protein